jgi:hypothetical protein
MPCKKCGKPLLFYHNEFKCARCLGFNVLEQDIAAAFYKTQIEFVRKKWQEYLSKFNKDSVMLGAARHREHYCRDILFSKYCTINLDRLFILTVVIQHAALYSNPKKGRIVDDASFQEVIDMGMKVLTIENAYTHVKASYSSIVVEEPFTQGKFTPDQFSKLKIVENERYNTVRETFAGIDVFTAQVAEEKAREILKNMKSEERKYRDFTAKEFVSSCYPLILSMYGGLLRSEYYSEAIDLRQFGNILTDPAELMKLVWRFTVNDDLTYASEDLFIEKAKETLKLSKKILKRNLLFGSGYDAVFPLFIVINFAGKKKVVISHRFAYFIYAILHATITKSLFDAETERLSLIFENNKVKSQFENCGYSYTNNQTVKSSSGQLEIDGIATKDGICYVVECKNWRFPPFVEEKTKAEQIVRDLEGIIDGKKFTTRNGVLQFERIKSLPEKVSFVNMNMNKFRLNEVEIKRISGLVVTPYPPPISIYKGVSIISFSQIVTL